MLRPGGARAWSLVSDARPGGPRRDAVRGHPRAQLAPGGRVRRRAHRRPAAARDSEEPARPDRPTARTAPDATGGRVASTARGSAQLTQSPEIFGSVTDS